MLSVAEVGTALASDEDAAAFSADVERDLGILGGSGGKRGPVVGGNGLRPRVDLLALPVGVSKTDYAQSGGSEAQWSGEAGKHRLTRGKILLDSPELSLTAWTAAPTTTGRLLPECDILKSL